MGCFKTCVIHVSVCMYFVYVQVHMREGMHVCAPACEGLK